MPDTNETTDSLEMPLPTAMDAMKERPVLLASVIVMGVLLVLGFVGVFSTIVYRVVSSPDVAEVSVRGQFGAIDVPVANGTSLLGTTFIEDRLSIVTSNEGVAEVIIIDTRRGVELGRIRLVPQHDGDAGSAGETPGN